VASFSDLDLDDKRRGGKDIEGGIHQHLGRVKIDDVKKRSRAENPQSPFFLLTRDGDSELLTYRGFEL